MRDLLLLLLILLSVDFSAYGYRIRNDRRATGIVKQPRVGRRTEMNYARPDRAIGIMNYPRVGRSDLPPLNFHFKKINEIESNEDFDTEPIDFERNEELYQYRNGRTPEEYTKK